MLESLQYIVARPLIGLWLTMSKNSWHRRVVASDSPHVHAPGMDPDRVLLAGDGAATGRGVVTHDLGLPGYLARSLSARTGRAADVDIVVSSTMTAKACLTSLAGIELDRYDIILLSLGANEALALTDEASWRESIDGLLAELGRTSPASTLIHLLPVPYLGATLDFPPVLGRVVDRHARRLNAASAEVVRAHPGVMLVPVAQVNAFEPESAHAYQGWAEAIAVPISNSLDPDRMSAGSTVRLLGQGRQRALEDLDVLNLESDDVLDGLTEQARRALGTRIAAVTLVKSDVQSMKSVRGMAPRDIRREEAFCDITIRRAAHFVIEDARLDSRYADYSIVAHEPAVRFYAGYPIESRDGQRVGALCVMDPEPRQFTLEDAAVLRSLAQNIQTHLWRVSGAER